MGSRDATDGVFRTSVISPEGSLENTLPSERASCFMYGPSISGRSSLLELPKTADRPASAEKDQATSFGRSSLGVTVIGHFTDHYIELAEQLGARCFNIPNEEWLAMGARERWEKNMAFLNESIDEKNEFELATPIERVRPGSSLEMEVLYLASKGYRLDVSGKRLVRS